MTPFVCPQQVHMDLVLSLGVGKPFWSEYKGHSTSQLVKQYRVDLTIPSAMLSQLVHFAYHRKCALTAQNSMAMAEIGAKFEIVSLVQYCLAYLAEHCSLDNVVKAFELASREQFQNQTVKDFFQKYIEDHFVEVREGELSVRLIELSIFTRYGIQIRLTC